MGRQWVEEPEYTRNVLKRRIALASPADEPVPALIEKLDAWNRAWFLLKPGDPRPVGLGAVRV